MGGNGATTEQARELVTDVIRLAREDDNKGLWAIDDDPSSDALFGLLSEKQTAQFAPISWPLGLAGQGVGTLFGLLLSRLWWSMSSGPQPG